MITKLYDETEISYDIECTDQWKEFIIKQNSGLNILECGLNDIEMFQKSPKFYPGHQIGDYCLYLGTYSERYGAFGAKVYNYDLYAHREFGHNHYYGTGIVFGPEDSNYYSGWPMSLNKSDNHLDVYKELFYREWACNLITNELIVEFFNVTFLETMKQKRRKWIRYGK